VNAAGATMNTDADVSSNSWVLDEDTMSSDSNTKVPTQQSVKAYIDTQIISEKSYQGGYDAATNTPDLDTTPIAGILKGDVYDVTVVGNFFTEAVEIGDTLRAKQDNPTLLTHWTIVQTNLNAASIKTQYESNADTNAFTDAEKTKLTGIETAATADQTGAEIKSLYEAEANTNAFTDANVTNLGNQSGINTGDEVAATESVQGIAEIATQVEVDAGTDDARFVTPLKLANSSLLIGLDAGTLDGIDSTGFLILAGQAGGQTGIGGTGTGENLLFQSNTSNDGLIAFGSLTTGVIYDEVNNRLGIATSTPTHTLTVNGDSLFNYGYTNSNFLINKANVVASSTGDVFTSTVGDLIVKVTSTSHGLDGSDLITVSASSNTTDLPNGDYRIIRINANSFNLRLNSAVTLGTGGTFDWVYKDASAVEYDTGTSRLQLYTDIDFHGQMLLDNGGEIRWDNSVENSKVYLTVSDTNVFNIGVFTSTVSDTINFRLGQSRTDHQFDLTKTTFNLGFANIDFAVNQNGTGTAIHYNAGTSLLELGSANDPIGTDIYGDVNIKSDSGSIDVIQLFNNNNVGTGPDILIASGGLIAVNDTFHLNFNANGGTDSFWIRTGGSTNAATGALRINSNLHTTLFGPLEIDATNAVSSANYTITNTDGYSDIDFTTGAVDRTCTLPTLSANIGRIIFISKVDSGVGKVTVIRKGTDTFIDGTTSVDITNQGDTILIKGSTLGWKLV